MAEDDKGLPELGRELVDMTVTYAKQETIQPLKALAKGLGWRIAGAAVGTIGIFFALLGLLRMLQTELDAEGFVSLIPYTATLIVAAGVCFLVATRMKGDSQ